MRAFNPLNFTDAPQQIQRSRLVDAPIAQVWDVVSDHRGMTEWMPMIKHVDLVEADDQGTWGEGCARNCQFGPDLLEERVLFWEPPYGYAYSIGDMHLVRDHVAHIALAREGDGTRVTWTQYYRPGGNAVKAFVAKRIMMPGVMSRALRNLGGRARSVAAQAATLLLAITVLASCAADLRPKTMKDAEQASQQDPAARDLLAAAVAKQGLDQVDRFETYEAIGRDDWRGLLGSMGRVWPWKDDLMALRFTLGDFDGQVEALEGKQRGRKAGLQSWDYYEIDAAGNYRTDVKDDKRVVFALGAYHYFFELGPRMLAAPVIHAYPDAELEGRRMHRAFVSWGTERTSDYDQYVVTEQWEGARLREGARCGVGAQSGLIEAVTHTVRDNYLPGAAPLYSSTYFSDFRNVDGVEVPFRHTVKLFHPDGEDEGGYVHQMQLESFTWDAFAPADIRPDADLSPVGDDKPAS